MMAEWRAPPSARGARRRGGLRARPRAGGVQLLPRGVPGPLELLLDAGLGRQPGHGPRAPPQLALQLAPRGGGLLGLPLAAGRPREPLPRKPHRVGRREQGLQEAASFGCAAAPLLPFRIAKVTPGCLKRQLAGLRALVSRHGVRGAARREGPGANGTAAAPCGSRSGRREQRGAVAQLPGTGPGEFLTGHEGGSTEAPPGVRPGAENANVAEAAPLPGVTSCAPGAEATEGEVPPPPG